MIPNKAKSRLLHSGAGGSSIYWNLSVHSDLQTVIVAELFRNIPGTVSVPLHLPFPEHHRPFPRRLSRSGLEDYNSGTMEDCDCRTPQLQDISTAMGETQNCICFFYFKDWITLISLQVHLFCECFACIHVSVPCAGVVPLDVRRGYQISSHWSYRCCEPPWGAVNWARSSGRPVSALNPKPSFHPCCYYFESRLMYLRLSGSQCGWIWPWIPKLLFSTPQVLGI